MARKRKNRRIIKLLIDDWSVINYVWDRVPLNEIDNVERYQELAREYLAAFPDAISKVNERYKDSEIHNLTWAIEEMEPPILEWIRSKGFDILDKELSPYAGTTRRD